MYRRYYLEHHDDNVQQCRECGGPIATCGHAERLWFPQRTVCYATMARAAAQRDYDALAETYGGWHDGTFENWAKERDEAHPFAHDDGVTIWVSEHDLTPEANWLSRAPAPKPEED